MTAQFTAQSGVGLCGVLCAQTAAQKPHRRAKKMNRNNAVRCAQQTHSLLAECLLCIPGGSLEPRGAHTAHLRAQDGVGA